MSYITWEYYCSLSDTVTEEAEGTETTYGELVRQAKSFIHNVLKNI